MARRSFSLKCPTCGINYFHPTKVIECYSCSYNRNVLSLTKGTK